MIDPPPPLADFFAVHGWKLSLFKFDFTFLTWTVDDGVPFDLSIGEFANEGNCAPTVNPLCKRKRGRFGFTAVTTRNDLSFPCCRFILTLLPYVMCVCVPRSTSKGQLEDGYCKKNWIFRIEIVLWTYCGGIVLVVR